MEFFSENRVLSIDYIQKEQIFDVDKFYTNWC